MVNREALDESFFDLGGTQKFINDVKEGPEWIPLTIKTTFIERAEYLEKQWRLPHFRTEGYPELEADAPPYLPYLCLLCLAWTEEGETL